MANRFAAVTSLDLGRSGESYPNFHEAPILAALIRFTHVSQKDSSAQNPAMRVRFPTFCGYLRGSLGHSRGRLPRGEDDCS
jgi:hypothetical protein